MSFVSNVRGSSEASREKRRETHQNHPLNKPERQLLDLAPTPHLAEVLQNRFPQFLGRLLILHARRGLVEQSPNGRLESGVGGRG